jgi:predicted nucleic acid-binding protein
MRKIIVLDSGPLGMISNPRAKSAQVQDCQKWFRSIIQSGSTVAIPEISDYEVRRELIRTDRRRSIQQLDQLKLNTIYLPITTAAILRAAELWAIVRQNGQPTADPLALDGDVILAAQVIEAFEAESNAIVATTNVAHISRFVQAKIWQDIEV